MVWPIRRLVTADGAAFRALRLEALQTYPDAFGSTYEDEVTRPLSSFIQQLEKSVVLGGFDHGELAGMIGFYRQSGPKDRHKGVIWGMYVKPRLHGGGLASALLNSAIELGKMQVEQIQLTVVTTNQRAVRLYAASGFCGYGIEKNALKSGETLFWRIADGSIFDLKKLGFSKFAIFPELASPAGLREVDAESGGSANF
jgi:ribosomal protein S18 acetylase RimI-like enzyme